MSKVLLKTSSALEPFRTTTCLRAMVIAMPRSLFFVEVIVSLRNVADKANIPQSRGRLRI